VHQVGDQPKLKLHCSGKKFMLISHRGLVVSSDSLW